MEKKLSEIDRINKKRGQYLSLTELATICKCCTKTMSKRLKQYSEDSDHKDKFSNYKDCKGMVPPNIVNIFYWNWSKP